uniref:ATP-dependent DNA helicase Q4 isoform X2 n=1 Tax=Myxine glutinosa TaxID=7769 RepID=UPI00358FECFA
MMDRCAQLRNRLKQWESEFVRKHQRKPHKVDIDAETTGIKDVYKEYASLKGNGRNRVQSESDETWGQHLNRGSKVMKRDSDARTLGNPTAVCGLKLKAKLAQSYKVRSMRLSTVSPRPPGGSQSRSSPVVGPVSTDHALISRPKMKVDEGPCDEELGGHMGTSVWRTPPTIQWKALDAGWVERCSSAAGIKTMTSDTATGSLIDKHLESEPTSDGDVNPSLTATSNRDSLKPMKPSTGGFDACLVEIARLPSSAADASQCGLAVLEDVERNGGMNISERKTKRAASSIVEPTERCTERTSKRVQNPSGGLERVVTLPAGDADDPQEGKERIGSGDSQADEHTGRGRRSAASGRSSRKRSRSAQEMSGTRKRCRKAEKSTSSKGCGVERDTYSGAPTGGTDEEKGRVVRGKDHKGRCSPSSENLFGEFEDVIVSRTKKQTGAKIRSSGNFVRINLKKKVFVKGRRAGANLRKQVWKQKWKKKQGGGGGGGYGGSWRSQEDDVCFKCGTKGHWASKCPGSFPSLAAPALPEEENDDDEEEEKEEALPTLDQMAEQALQSSNPSMDVQEGGGDPHRPWQVAIPAPPSPPRPPTQCSPYYSLGSDGSLRDTPREVDETLHLLGYEEFRPGQEEAIMRVLSGMSTLLVLSTGGGKSLCYQLPAFMYARRSCSIALVISPLVSLMDDQVSGQPAGLRAACLHSNMTKKQREAVVQKAKDGKLHALLLSPEALVGSGRFGFGGCLPPANQLPPISFACIDEAHCLSEWSHNFRPSYLRLCKVLRERLGVSCVLGLTATATLTTMQNLAPHLGLPATEVTLPVCLARVPLNLHLSVSADGNRDQALVRLLCGERFSELCAVIVYCTRRDETERVAALIRTCLQDVVVPRAGTNVGQKKQAKMAAYRGSMSACAEAYHAGLSPIERRRVQTAFMGGTLRIVVATVAFGMGLDRADVNAVLHYNLPRSLENYVQEIGRAGRDGRPAHCHLFLNKQGTDMLELRRHVFADSVDRVSVKRLLQKVFAPCRCRALLTLTEQTNVDGAMEDSLMDDFDEKPFPDDNVKSKSLLLTEPSVSSSELHLDRDPSVQTPAFPAGGTEKGIGNQWRAGVCTGHDRALPMEEQIQSLDIREEGIETLLCYLELHADVGLQVLHPTYCTCRLQCYGGPEQLRRVSRKCQAVAVALGRAKLGDSHSRLPDELQFDVVALADSMGWDPMLVKRDLRQLQWTVGADGRHTRSGVLVEFSDLAFHFRAPGDLQPEQLDQLIDATYEGTVEQERRGLFRLMNAFRTFSSVAFPSYEACADKCDIARSERLKQCLSQYFEREQQAGEGHDEDYCSDGDSQAESGPYTSGEAGPTNQQKGQRQDIEDSIRRDIQTFVGLHHDRTFTPRAVVRIFHGIDSPCFPAKVWGRDRRYWRRHLDFDFHRLLVLTREEITGFR